MIINQTAAGLSGRRVTLVVVCSLLLVMIFVGYCLWVFNHLERSREQAVAAWRGVASELSLRNYAFEKVIAQGVDSQLIDIARGEKFRLSVDRFSTTTQIDKQIDAAQEVELRVQVIRKTLANRPEAADLIKEWDPIAIKPPRLSSALDAYADVVQKQKELLSSIGGRVLLLFVRLTQPREFQIVSAVPNSRIL